MPILDLPEDNENTPKKEPSKEWKDKHKVYLTDDEIAALNMLIEEQEKTKNAN